jgi:hypothetical protein
MAFRLAPVGQPHLLRPAPSKIMFLRPARRAVKIAHTAANGAAFHLIACNGKKPDGTKCDELIWVKPSEKSDCPHCGHIYSAGYFAHAGPRLIEKSP